MPFTSLSVSEDEKLANQAICPNGPMAISFRHRLSSAPFAGETSRIWNCLRQESNWNPRLLLREDLSPAGWWSLKEVFRERISTFMKEEI